MACWTPMQCLDPSPPGPLCVLHTNTHSVELPQGLQAAGHSVTPGTTCSKSHWQHCTKLHWLSAAGPGLQACY